MIEFQDRVAIVTGAGGGLGKAYATLLASRGAAVVVNDLGGSVHGDGEDATTADTVVAEIEAAGGTAVADYHTVAEPKGGAAIVETALDNFGRVDILINNAALYATLTGGRFDSLAEAEWDACMSVNIKGIWNCCKAVVPAMRAVGAGSIVNISSLAATYGMPYALHYTTSKAAVIGLTKSVAKDFVGRGIRCNAICPATVDSPSLQSRIDAFDDPGAARTAFIARQPMGRLGTVEEIAALCVYLASEESAFTTGTAVVVDGGWST